MYATTREDMEIMMAIHGPFPVFVLTEGRSRNKEDNEISKLSQAMCSNQHYSKQNFTLERMTMTPIDII